MTSPAALAYPPGSAAAHAAAAHAHQQVSPAALSSSSQAQAHHGTPPMYLHAGAAQSASPASGLHSLPLHPVSMGISAFPSSGVLPRRASYPPPAGAGAASADGHSTTSAGGGGGAPFSSGLDALASLASAGNAASSTSAADVSRFASRIRQPISALADAVAQLGGGEGDEDASGSGSASEGRDDTEERKPARAGDERGEAGAAVGGGAGKDGVLGEGRAEGGAAAASAVASTSAGVGATGRKESRERGEPPRKRSRMSGAAVAGGPAPNAGLSVNPERFDVVAKGLIGDTQARTLVLLCVDARSVLVTLSSAHADSALPPRSQVAARARALLRRARRRLRHVRVAAPTLAVPLQHGASSAASRTRRV